MPLQFELAGVAKQRYADCSKRIVAASRVLGAKQIDMSAVKINCWTSLCRRPLQPLIHPHDWRARKTLRTTLDRGSSVQPQSPLVFVDGLTYVEFSQLHTDQINLNVQKHPKSVSGLHVHNIHPNKPDHFEKLQYRVLLDLELFPRAQTQAYMGQKW
jgi:hypothetical protein